MSTQLTSHRSTNGQVIAGWRSAPIAAGDAQHTTGLAGGVIHAGFLAGGLVGGVDAAVETYRVGAVAGRGKLLFPAGEIVAGSEVEQLTG
jgi:hypothetical protein